MAHHRKPPMFGIPEHPAEKFHAHSMNLDARVNHDLNMVAHHKTGVMEHLTGGHERLTRHKNGVTERLLTHHRHHR